MRARWIVRAATRVLGHTLSVLGFRADFVRPANDIGVRLVSASMYVVAMCIKSNLERRGRHAGHGTFRWFTREMHIALRSALAELPVGTS